MLVREATSADAQSIADVHEQSIRELTRDSYSIDVVEAWASGKDPERYAIESNTSYFVVAEVDAGIAGFGHLEPMAADYFHSSVDGEIRAIYVHPEHSGEGVGSAIYNELEGEAERLDIESLGLWASVNAVGFYESHGFNRTRDITHEFGGAVEGPAVEMRKEL